MVTNYNSFFGFVHFFKSLTERDKSRTPYPAIMAEPHLKDVLRYFNLADFGLFTIFNIVHSFTIFNLMKLNQKNMTQQEILKYYRISNNLFRGHLAMGVSFGLFFAYTSCIYRLKGFTPNGLQWQFKDTTSYY